MKSSFARPILYVAMFALFLAAAYCGVKFDFLASYKGTPFHDTRYSGGPQKIPGTVYCAYYDLGGEGVAYHDSDAKNSGSGGLNPLDGTPLSRKSPPFTTRAAPSSSAPSPLKPASRFPKCCRRSASSIPFSTPNTTSRKPRSSPAPASAAPSPSPPTWPAAAPTSNWAMPSPAGGLHVIGTERHESRRIDRQLRGRCARQGDPGSSHFFISLEDDLMRLFGSDKIVKVMERVGLEEGQELEHFMLDRSIQTAQKRVEQQNFQRRKRTLEYDDVMNQQREVIYGFRDEVINAGDVRDRLMDIMEEVVIAKVRELTPESGEPQDWNAAPLANWVNLNFPLTMPEEEIIKAAKSGTSRRWKAPPSPA